MRTFNAMRDVRILSMLVCVFLLCVCFSNSCKKTDRAEHSIFLPTEVPSAEGRGELLKKVLGDISGKIARSYEQLPLQFIVSEPRISLKIKQLTSSS